MTLSDELSKLSELRDRGLLTEEEFKRAKERLLGGAPRTEESYAPPGNRLRRSSTDRWVAGVCAGIGHALGIESWIVRLLFTVLVLFAGTGVLAYVLLWIFVPSEPDQ
jgi:phage shock protein PspC (stress-responsive transcriptional regulator)